MYSTSLQEKRCSDCGEVRPIEQFGRRKDSPDGYRGVCKPCLNKQQAERLASDEAKTKRQATIHRYNHSEKGKRNVARHRQTEKRRGYLVAWMETKRAKESGVSGSFTREEFADLCARHGNKCLRCGATGVRLAADHVVPLSRGGSGGIENIQPLCMRCNGAKGCKDTDYRGDVLMKEVAA
jgi:5-methylcytosine-specific restriction endonuclease McrA